MFGDFANCLENKYIVRGFRLGLERLLGPADLGAQVVAKQENTSNVREGSDSNKVLPIIDNVEPRCAEIPLTSKNKDRKALFEIFVN